MSINDNDLATEKVQPVDGQRKDDEPPRGTLPTMSARISAAELYLVDAAALRIRKKRAELIYEATMAKVREILGIPQQAA